MASVYTAAGFARALYDGLKVSTTEAAFEAELQKLEDRLEGMCMCLEMDAQAKEDKGCEAGEVKKIEKRMELLHDVVCQLEWISEKEEMTRLFEKGGVK